MTPIGDSAVYRPPVLLRWQDLVGIFVVGAFGGMSPFLLRLAMDLINNKSRIEFITTSIAIGIALLAILGGGIATIWKESDLKKAFYLGLGLPSLLTVATSNAPPGNGARAAGTPSLIVFTVSAAENGVGPAKGRTIRANVPPEAGNDILLTFNPNNEKAAPSQVQIGAAVQVPDAAESVTISCQFADSDNLLLPATPNAEITLIFRSEADPWYGFWYAIGRKSKPLRLVLEKREVRTAPEAVTTSKESASDCSSMRVNQGKFGTVQSKGKSIYVFLAGQSHQFKLGVFNPPDKAHVFVATKPEIFKAIDALETKIVNSASMKALHDADPQGIVEQQIENRQPFTVTVDGQQFNVTIETHTNLRYAIFSICAT
jgi:hypothetical protein